MRRKYTVSLLLQRLIVCVYYNTLTKFERNCGHSRANSFGSAPFVML